MTTRPRQSGFTLLEVLVALVIIAVALAAASRAAGALIDNSGRSDDIMMAQWCANNALVQARLQLVMPPIGTATAQCVQAGRDYPVEIVTSATPNPSLRRVDARVHRADGSLVLVLSTLVGRW